jgi:hypothetical protein
LRVYAKRFLIAGDFLALPPQNAWGNALNLVFSKRTPAEVAGFNQKRNQEFIETVQFLLEEQVPLIER